MKIMDVAQGSPEWLVARCGCVTASKVKNIVEKTAKGKHTAAYDKYLMDVVIERITGRMVENYVSPAMDWGIEQEPYAKAAYEAETGHSIDAVGIAFHPTIEWFASSPDGLVGSDGLVETKCPNTSTHLAYMLEGAVPLDYMPQMLAQMACTERKWVDFVSYDPRLPAKLQFFCRRFHRNEEHIAMMEAEVRAFLDEVTLKLGELANRAGVNMKSEFQVNESDD